MSGRSDYTERRENRIERLRARADKVRDDGNGRIASARGIADRIPFGQPILVGHHSERRARRDAEKIHNGFARGFESLKQADELDRRADSAEASKAISSDNPDAIGLLREKLAAVNAEHAKWKAALKGPNVEQNLLAMGVPAITADFIVRVGGSGRLSNLRAEALRIEKRIAELDKAAARGPIAPEQHGEVRISESENRVCIEFPGKPSDEVRARLKQNGFRWAPSVGAWVRLASDRAWYLARQIATNEGPR